MVQGNCPHASVSFSAHLIMYNSTHTPTQCIMKVSSYYAGHPLLFHPSFIIITQLYTAHGALRMNIYLPLLGFREVLCPPSPHVDLASQSDRDVAPASQRFIASLALCIHHRLRGTSEITAVNVLSLFYDAVQLLGYSRAECRFPLVQKSVIRPTSCNRNTLLLVCALLYRNTASSLARGETFIIDNTLSPHHTLTFANL